MKNIPLHSAASLAALCAAAMSSAAADPLGGVVIDGGATIGVTGQTTTITQTSDKAIIEWQSFDVAANEKVNFVQPSSAAIALNRVLGSGPSIIDGQIDANGGVFIINGDGVVFGASAKIDINSLLATSMDISNAGFMSGAFDFNQAGSPAAAIINNGKITADEGGMIAFVAPNVRNSGVLNAYLGKVALGAGEAFTLDFFGDQLIVFSASNAAGAKTGEIIVDGEISAESGTILLSATAARDFIDTIINVEADLVARSANLQGGKIILTGAENSVVTIDAALDATGTPGGSISVTGGKIAVTAGGSLLTDAKTGQADGGDIFVQSTEETTFAGLASSEPGAANGVGGDIAIGSDGVLIFTGTARAGTPPRNGVISLNGQIDDDAGGGTGGGGGGGGGGSEPPVIVPGPPIKEEAGDRLTEVAGQTAELFDAATSEADANGVGAQVLVGSDVAFDFSEGAATAPPAGDARLLCLHGVSAAACGAGPSE